MDSSTPGLPLLHYLLELAPVHVYWIGDAIQTSHFLPLSPLFAFNLSQHRVFSKSQLFASGGQTTGASASAAVLSTHIHSWSPLGLTSLISLLSKGLSRVFSSSTVQIIVSILKHSAFFKVQLSHLYMTIGKTTALTLWAFVGKVMSFLFNMLSRFAIAFLSRSKCPLISQLQSPSTVIWEPKKRKICHYFHFFPFYSLWNDGTRCHDLCFLNGEF